MAEKKNTVRKRGRPPKSVINDKPSREILEQLYEQMILIRRFEEKAGQLYGMGISGGSVTSTSVRKLLLLGCSLWLRKGTLL